MLVTQGLGWALVLLSWHFLVDSGTCPPRMVSPDTWIGQWESQAFLMVSCVWHKLYVLSLGDFSFSFFCPKGPLSSESKALVLKNVSFPEEPTLKLMKPCHLGALCPSLGYRVQAGVPEGLGGTGYGERDCPPWAGMAA